MDDKSNNNCVCSVVLAYGTAVLRVLDTIPASEQMFVRSANICFGVSLFLIYNIHKKINTCFYVSYPESLTQVLLSLGLLNGSRLI